MRRAISSSQSRHFLSPVVASALAGLLLLPSAVNGVNYFKGLDSLDDFHVVGITDDHGIVVKNTLLSFSNKKCQDDVYNLGFPFDYFDLPGVVFELAQVGNGRCIWFYVNRGPRELSSLI